MASLKELINTKSNQPKATTSVIAERTGIILEQNKEPALSRDMRRLCTEKLDEKIIKGYEPGGDDIDIIAISKSAKIIDETTGLPLFEILRDAFKNHCATIIIDAIDDEPYISSQLAPALKMSELLSRGVQLAKRATGATHAEIEIYKNLFDSQIKIGREIEGIPVVRVGGGYPAENMARRAKPKNAVVIGACALIHLSRAVDLGKVQTTCFVTVAGDCVAMPVNLEVTMDKTLEDVLTFCGLMFDPSRVVVGGSMKGFAVTDIEQTLVTPLTRGVLAFKEVFKDYHMTCIGCGRCAEVCPQGLSPYYIYKFVTGRKYKMLQDFDIELCTECGTCSYICPSKLNISSVIAVGKREMRAYSEHEEILRQQRLQRQIEAQVNGDATAAQAAAIDKPVLASPAKKFLEVVENFKTNMAKTLAQKGKTEQITQEENTDITKQTVAQPDTQTQVTAAGEEEAKDEALV